MGSSFYKQVGNRLRFHRQARGLSQSALAEKLGLTFQQVQKYESGANRIPLDRLIESCRHLNVPPTLFLGEELKFDDEALYLLKPLQKVKDPQMRSKIGEIIHILAAE